VDVRLETEVRAIEPVDGRYRVSVEGADGPGVVDPI
jgi:hypothetical protein